MCLAIPMKVVKISGEEAVVKTRSLERKANLCLVKNVKVGDYILMHAGFAIEKVKSREAVKTLKIMRSIEL